MSANFKINDFCVYKTHGIAKVIGFETIKFDNTSTKCYVLYFEKEKLTLTIPMKYKDTNELRKLSTMEDMEKIFSILRNSQRKIKGMWSRRAKEYEEKINSGNIFDVAEVLQDLIRDVDDADRSYSERIIYETAIYRLASELSIIKKIPYKEAEALILETAKEKINFKNKEEDSEEDEAAA